MTVNWKMKYRREFTAQADDLQTRLRLHCAGTTRQPARKRNASLALRHDLREALLRHFQRAIDIAVQRADREPLQPGPVRIVEETREDCRLGPVDHRQGAGGIQQLDPIRWRSVRIELGLRKELFVVNHERPVDGGGRGLVAALAHAQAHARRPQIIDIGQGADENGDVGELTGRGKHGREDEIDAGDKVRGLPSQQVRRDSQLAESRASRVQMDLALAQ